MERRNPTRAEIERGLTREEIESIAKLGKNIAVFTCSNCILVWSAPALPLELSGPKLYAMTQDMLNDFGPSYETDVKELAAAGCFIPPEIASSIQTKPWIAYLQFKEDRGKWTAQMHFRLRDRIIADDVQLCDGLSFLAADETA